MYSAKDLFRFLAQASVFLRWAISFPASAQIAHTPSIQGPITDPDHAATAGVKIKIGNRVSGLTRTAQTNLLGLYTVPGLLVTGQYVISIEKSGFAEAQSTLVVLAGGITVQIDFQLHLGGGETEITVKGSVGQYALTNCNWAIGSARPRSKTAHGPALDLDSLLLALQIKFPPAYGSSPLK